MMGIGNLIKNFLNPKPRIIMVPIDPDSVRENTLIKALNYENSELKARTAKKDKIIAEFRQREQDKSEEENVKEDLNRQKQELRSDSDEVFFSLKQFFGKYFRDKKFREKLGFYSFDRSKKLANFGDIRFSGSGDVVLVDNKNNLVLGMKNLKDIFQSAGALGNDIARGMIPINLDKEGDYIENIMVYEAPELIQTGDKLRFAKARKRPVYEIIQQLNGQIASLHQELAESEMINTELQNKIDKIDSEVNVHQQMAETSRAELTNNEQRLVGIDKVFRNTQREMIQLQGLSAIQEDNISKLESEIELMRKKAEREGVKLPDERALDLIERIRSTIVNELPDIQPVQIQESSKSAVPHQ